jgi:hypothetical protein
MKMHFGNNGNAMCEASRLLGGTTTMDVSAVDCLGCLWVVLAHSFDSSQKVAERIRVVTAERMLPERTYE